MCRVMPIREIVDTVRVLQTHAKLPMLIAANFEKGGTDGGAVSTRGAGEWPRRLYGAAAFVRSSASLIWIMPPKRAFPSRALAGWVMSRAPGSCRLSTCRQRPGSDLPAACMGGCVKQTAFSRALMGQHVQHKPEDDEAESRHNQPEVNLIQP